LSQLRGAAHAAVGDRVTQIVPFRLDEVTSLDQKNPAAGVSHFEIGVTLGDTFRDGEKGEE
jgi:hypothetical protein